MKSRRIILILLITLLSLLGGVIYYFYNSMNYKERSLLESVPQNSVKAILNSKNCEQFINRVTDSTLLINELIEIPSFAKIVQPLRNLTTQIETLDDTAIVSSFVKRQFLISIHLTEGNSLITLYSFHFKNRNEKRAVLSSLKPSITDEIYKDFKIFKFLDSKTNEYLFYTINESFLVISTNKQIIKSSINQQLSPLTSLIFDNEFNKVLKLSSNLNFDNLFLKISGSYDKSYNSILNNFTPQLVSSMSSWSEFDIDYKKDILFINGIILEGSNERLLHNFLNNNYGQMTLDEVYPSYISNFVNYSFNDSIFYNRYRTFLRFVSDSANVRNKPNYNQDQELLIDPLLKVMDGEFGLANNVFTDSLLIIKLNSISNAKEAFEDISNEFNSEISEVEKWQVDQTLSISIYRGMSESILSYLFAPFFQTMPNRFHIFFDDYLVLSNNLEELKRFYKNYLTKNNLSNSSSFQAFRNNFSSDENLYIYSRCNSLDYFFSNKDSNSQSQKYYYSIASQLVVNNSTFFSSYILNRAPYIPKNEKYEWKSVLDSSLLSFSSIIENPQNNELNYLVQDCKYNLYLINTIGRIIWKRPINEKILGGINQLSINSKPLNALIFNTKSKLFQIDFEGNGIGNYPVLLPSMAVESISIFDYDKNGDFRLFVPCVDNQIRVYDKKGNLVVGFEADKIEGDILQNIQHYLVTDKDYILISDDHSNRILDRKGKQRIDIKSDFKRCANSSYYLLKEGKSNYFITSSTKGEVVIIEIPSGKVSKFIGYTESKEHYFFLVDTKQKDQAYLFLSDNGIKLLDTKGLTIYNKELSNLKVSVPRLIYNKENNPYISFIDLESNNVYLFDVIKGLKMDGFPLEGHSDYQIYFDDYGNVKILTGGELNTMILYN